MLVQGTVRRGRTASGDPGSARSAAVRPLAATVLFVLAAGAFLLTLGGSGKAASPGPWLLPATPISAAGANADGPEVTVTPDGVSTVIWKRRDGSNDIVQAATRPPDGRYGEPIDLSEPGQNVTVTKVASAPDGTVTAVWSRSNGSKRVVQASTRPPGGEFGPPEDLSNPDFNAWEPAIVFAADGAATVIWRGGSAASNAIQAATRPPGGAFGMPVTISAGSDAFRHDIAAAPDGSVTVAWYRTYAGNDTVQVTTRPPGGTFGTPVDISAAGEPAKSPRLAIGGDGTTAVVWLRTESGDDTLRAAVRPPGGAFGAPVDLSLPATAAGDHGVVVAPDDTVTAVWYRYDGSHRIVESATRPPGGDFGAPVDLSEPGQTARDPVVAIAPDGTVTAGWSRFDGTDRRIQVTSRRPGEAFGPPQDLSAPGQDGEELRIAFADAGTGIGTAAWKRSDGSHRRIEAASTATPKMPRPCAKLTVKRLRKNRKNGTATLVIRVTRPGKVSIKKNAKVKPFTRQAKKAGKVKLKIRAKGKALRQLKRRGRAKVRAVVVYRPRNACQKKIVRKRKLTLIRRR